MKTLKVDHTTAEKILRGKITATWRLYDDKDLSVNDRIVLIDKVDPKNPATWRPIGTAEINTIVQKRLRDIGEPDYADSGMQKTAEDMLPALQRFYGPHITFETTVKIIRFTFSNKLPVNGNYDVEDASVSKELNLYADGGSRGNPGPSASGYVITKMDGDIVVKEGIYLGLTTNNQAEYQALKLGLEEAVRIGADKVHVYMDSLLVINQMLGIFKVKNRDLWPIHAAIKNLTMHFKHVSFTHVPRELNKLADAAVNEALDAAVHT